MTTTTAHVSPQLQNGRFRNPARMHRGSLAKMLGIMWRALFDKPADTVPVAPIPVQALTRAAIEAAPDNTVFRLGHSTVLLKLNGGLWLTDPVFGKRASPFPFMGPARFHAPPLTIDELPPLAGVILSHDHYDHLDHAAVVALAGKTQYFVTPLGVGDRLVQWGVPAEKIRQMDWWRGVRLDGISLTCTPAQHFSGRSLTDGNSTLWCSWVIDSGSHRVFFSGDSGYFRGFKAIGDQFGPFDLTMIETGAYDANWPDVHMQPEQTLQAHIDLRGQVLLPIHNGTFDLAFHAWHEPLDRIAALADARGERLATPVIGQGIGLAAPHVDVRWWQGLARA
ncbi:L-ascorbate metabolism protein UlaG (beta-lactamase superfamily) [Pseudoduganella lurida]|uniref:L-ascorbate metabolism protein UlaG (Beta-lactamase superfamily) n=1 Tax=Pseudoduganella lurida TaxID=1036180 RepID=A0A562R1U1_9BURK|nr:MBL fold metallo-hydrolase [Pseudoduganella lurida]TWI63029.1 L-ascorbate metabolism protein UlaG (beta-lactamase superfamily) [Pseudoduganella lurida]